jgi:hypothetical protein
VTRWNTSRELAFLGSSSHLIDFQFTQVYGAFLAVNADKITGVDSHVFERTVLAFFVANQLSATHHAGFAQTVGDN